MKENDINKIVDIFQNKYPEPETSLVYKTPFELLVATILSAQTTDKQVNKVTAKLFKEYNIPAEFSKLSRKELENKIKSIGLYRNKSKYIIETSKLLVENFNGVVPSTRKELMKLPGVGRKTANVVLACAFTQNAFPVDTHVFRVANRIGLANSDKVGEVERQLMHYIPEEEWSKMHHWLIFHGREVCKAQNPECNECEIRKLCTYNLTK